MSLQGEKGKTQGIVDRLLTERINELKDVLAKSCADSFRGAGLRKWYLPQSWLDKHLNLCDIENFYIDTFDRTELNNVYEKAMRSAEDAGTEGDIVSLKNQIDYFAAMERAINLRYASPVRCIVHSQMRKFGNSVSNVFPTVLRQFASAIQNGGQ